MAEAALFSVASKLLSTIASPTFEKACAIWKATDELDKLKSSIETIQAALLDAEKKQSSHTVKVWIKRVSNVLYDADDLFDEVATDDLRMQNTMKGDHKLQFLKKVRLSWFKLNSIVSGNSMVQRVKIIRKSLLEISSDMAGLGFVLCDKEVETPMGMRRDQDPGSYVDSNDVIGRDKEKNIILEMLSSEPNKALVVISIAGIGGMGKTTIAQLIFNDDVVKKNFKETWFACISDTSDDKEIIRKFFQSICKEENYSNYSVGQLQSKIRESVEGRKFFLVLDDVWDDDHGRWLNRMSLFNKCAKGSKILVTTRSSSVARAMEALETLDLGGLSEEDSWTLFKKLSFVLGKENNERWIDIGREIVKKCVNVPLAIRSIGSLLYTKNTIQEWESFRELELSKIEEPSIDSIMNALKLSYAHLPSNSKHCFAYCSMFSKDFKFDVKKLIYMWIAQGYVQASHEKQRVEEVGYSYFMDLLRRGFFQEAAENEYGEVESCKMHDLVHDLALCVAGEEIGMVSGSSNPFNKRVRHASVGCNYFDIRQIVARELNVDLNSLTSDDLKDFWENVARPLDYKRVRSVLFPEYCHYVSALNQQFTKFKCLRALSLRGMGFKMVSSCIGGLKQLRYLDLSRNRFESLPDSLTNMVNLLTLDLKFCLKLKALPSNFRNLRNLRCLNISECVRLKHMPTGMGEMSCLQYLSNFKIGKPIEVKQLTRLHHLRGGLSIQFDEGIGQWDVDDSWQLPMSLEKVNICKYPGMKIAINWSNHNSLLAVLELRLCYKVKYLPPLKCLPYIKSLGLYDMPELEYVEEENEDKHTSNNDLFSPQFEILNLEHLPRLKGWQRSSKTIMLPRLSKLSIQFCPVLESIPLCPSVEILYLQDSGSVLQYLMSSSSSLEALTCLRDLSIKGDNSLEIMHLSSSPHLQQISIYHCKQLTSFHAQALSSLRELSILECERLKKLSILHLNVLENLKILKCNAELELWGQQEACAHVDWASLPNLHSLEVDRLPKKIPTSLEDRQALGKLQFIHS